MYNLNLDLIKDFGRYLEYIDVSPSTARFYMSDVRQFIRWITKRDYQDIDGRVVDEYIAYLRGKSTPKRTLNRKLSSLRRLSEFMKKDFMKNVANEKVNLKSRRFKINTTAVAAGTFLVVASMVAYPKGEVVDLTNPLDTTSKVRAEQIANKIDLTAPTQIKKVSGGKVTIVLEDPEKVSFEGADRLPLVLNASSQRDSLEGGRIYKVDGEAVIYKGNTNTKVVNPLVDEESKIFVTATADTGGQALYIAEQGYGYFIVALQKATNTDISFNWLISN